jgi:hypothetical protein
MNLEPCLVLARPPAMKWDKSSCIISVEGSSMISAALHFSPAFHCSGVFVRPCRIALLGYPRCTADCVCGASVRHLVSLPAYSASPPNLVGNAG